MISVDVPVGLSKSERYRFISARLEALAAGESDALANLCNFSAFLFHTLGDVNWVGVYVLRGGELVLGPFAGKPACTRIALGNGVCGTAAACGKPQLVPDVHAFPGHIACDGASNSEIVIPLYASGELWGVLDLDSPVLGRFDETDLAGLIPIAERYGTLAEKLSL